MKNRLLVSCTVWLMVAAVVITTPPACKPSSAKQEPVYAYSFENIAEIDNQLLVYQNKKIIFSQNDSGFYQLKSYDIATKQITTLTTEHSNHANPFLFSAALCWQKEVLPGQNILEGHSGWETLRDNYARPVASENGKYLLMRNQLDNTMFVLCDKDSVRHYLPKINGQFNGAVFSEQHDLLVLSIGNYLKAIHLPDTVSQEIGGDVAEKKINPFIFQNTLYYSSYGKFDRYSVYKTPIAPGKIVSSGLVLQRAHDLRMPKTNGKWLFFIEIVNSEYLLKAMEIKTGLIKDITNKGVVYGYELVNDELFYVYSDLQTPRALVRYSLASGVSTHINALTTNNATNASLVYRPGDSIPAYELAPTDSTPVKAVILYFHPGRRNDDYSPRWDNMLLAFCKNGYRVICPNFPSSAGYGKKYENLDAMAAADAMTGWIKTIVQRYPGVPLYLYGISSGCTIIETCLKEKLPQVKGIIGAFALSADLAHPGEEMQSIPTLYILGKNDPVIPYTLRYTALQKLQKVNKQVAMLTFDNEGHWIQHPENFYTFFGEAMQFMQNNH